MVITRKIISSLPTKTKKKVSKNPFNKKLSIKLTSWDYVCGDGCCHTYGVDIRINDKLLSGDGESSQQLVKEILTHLGYTNVEVESDYEEDDNE